VLVSIAVVVGAASSTPVLATRCEAASAPVPLSIPIPLSCEVKVLDRYV
jgi:hypothetical protein